MTDTAVNPPSVETLSVDSSSRVSGTRAALGDEVAVHLRPQGTPLFVTPISSRLNQDQAVASEVSHPAAQEWRARVDLAACYRLVDLFG
ncbi:MULTISPECIES: hypothetical protein [Paraburkholderia]|uniref:hypothetical protein n=1 Tax=Paraburkholderia TaxID=1822464 RepID=UPI00225223AA|nr:MULTISPECIES: hypothetical protein [Paraburkholderia]MCX4174584.1 hypothetical protein [Paraburkholderia madseniana]MDQ6462585.1 hypothetical protein [Paraburkholderia madseniana]